MPQPQQVSEGGRRDAAVAYPGDVLRISAGYAWRLLVIGIVGYFVLRILGHLMTVVVPFTISLLLTAALRPLTTWLYRHGVPRAIATIATLIVAVVVIGGIIALVVTRAINEAPQLAVEVNALIPKVEHWLIKGPLHLNQHTINHFSDNLTRLINHNGSAVTHTAVSTGRTALDVLAALVFGLFTTIFLLYDGERVWHFVCRCVPRAARAKADAAGQAAWTSLSHYVRSQVLIALFHGLSVGITLSILGVPLVMPLALLVAIGSFVPLVGAIVAGVLAAAVAALSHGVVAALVVVAVLILDSQVEGHILQPLVIGRYVHLHPLAVILGLAVGTFLLGVFGALIAVPSVACLNSAIRSVVPPEDEGPAGPLIVARDRD